MSNVLDRLKSAKTSEKYVKSREKRAIPEIYEFDNDIIPITALYQSYWWRDKTGKPYVITNMHPLHAQRALRKLWGTFHKEIPVGLEASPLWAALSKQAGSSY